MYLPPAFIASSDLSLSTACKLNSKKQFQRSDKLITQAKLAKVLTREWIIIYKLCCGW